MVENRNFKLEKGKLYWKGKMINKAVKFVKEAYSELSKVTWLKKAQVVQSTIFVFIIVLLVSLYINAVDFGLSKLLGFILRR